MLGDKCDPKSASESTLCDAPLPNPVTYMRAIFGSQRAIAKAAECDHAAVVRWKAAGRVPMGNWARLRAAAESLGFVIPVEVLCGMREHESTRAYEQPLRLDEALILNQSEGGG